MLARKGFALWFVRRERVSNVELIMRMVEFYRRTALTFPPSCMLRSCFQVQLVSSCVERTNVRCTPRLRCTAEQSRQMNTPYVTDDHVGFFALQSKHTCATHKPLTNHSRHANRRSGHKIIPTLLAEMLRKRWKTASISLLLGPESAIFDVLSRFVKQTNCQSVKCLPCQKLNHQVVTYFLSMKGFKVIEYTNRSTYRVYTCNELIDE